MLDGEECSDMGRLMMLLDIRSLVPSPSYDSHVSNDVELLSINSSFNICIDRIDTFERPSTDPDDVSDDSSSSRPVDSVSVEMSDATVSHAAVASGTERLVRVVVTEHL
jgi:hypothetical protein